MDVAIFKYKEGKFVKSGVIPNSSGFWNSIVAVDIDNDGDIDLVAGNWGLNSKLKFDADHPAKLYEGDFDNNGVSECIPTFYKTDGKSYPYYLKGDITNQIPMLKKKFLRYDTYAGKTIEEILSSDQLNNATVLTANQSQTCIFYNDGKGNFTMKPLPQRAQFAPVFGILVDDFNGDGIKDIFLAGNFYGLKPEVGRLDANYGVTYLGSNNGNYSYIEPLKSGLFIKDGEVRDVKEINTKKGKLIIVARNNDPLLLFRKEK
jgi:hypothetical protein